MMAALCYNLKKYMRFKSNKAESIARVLELDQIEPANTFFGLFSAIYRPFFV
jgi:hypothetical protein